MAESGSVNGEVSSPRVLVVEDDDVLRAAICEVLVEEGYVVECVGDIAGARRVLARVRPALVLLDLRVHGESAEPLLAELSSIVSPSSTVVVSGSTKGIETAFKYGVLFVGKPFEIDTLLATLRRAAIEGPALLLDSPKRQSGVD